jgi:lipopolysaccharide transport system permease protein
MLTPFGVAYQHRDLVLSFALRDIKSRYKQTVLGVAWAVLQPLSMMVVFTVVLSLVAQVPSDGIPYPVFAYSGLVFWTFFANTITSGTVSMVANSPLIRKIYFPREALLVAVILAGGLDLLIACSLFGGLLLYYGIPLTWQALWVLPLLALQMVFSLGVMSFTSAVHVNFRDIGHGLPLAMQLWMFATPVAYPLSVIPGWLMPLYLLNPMASVIDGYRRALLHGTRPELALIALSAVVILAFATIAVTFFRRAERTFADVI